MKQQYILGGTGLVLVILLFVFGRTTENKKPAISPVTPNTAPLFDIKQYIFSAKQKLSSSQTLYIASLENGISRGDVASQQVKTYESLANFWKDSMRLFEPYAFYLSEASKLVNSEKNLNFAAQLILDNLRAEQDVAKLNWEAAEAIDLFERAIKLNPDNDDLRIGLGSVYVYGKGRSGNAQETMKGIQELLTVVRNNPNNMKAQMVLGVGGLVSGQFDKAIERLNKVVAAEPDNVEAISYLADAYGAKGDKAEAIKWYNISKRLINDPHFTKEVDDRIKMLQ